MRINADALNSATSGTDGLTFVGNTCNYRSGTDAALRALIVVETTLIGNDLAGLNIVGNSFVSTGATNRPAFWFTGSGTFLPDHAREFTFTGNSHADGLTLMASDDEGVTYYDMPLVKQGAAIHMGGEEETFTATIEDSSGNVSATTGTGSIERRGGAVTIHLPLINNIDTTGMTGTDVLRIPLGVTATQDAFGDVSLAKVGFGTHTAASLYVIAGNGYATIRKTGPGLAAGSVLVSDLTSGAADIGGTITVRV